MPRLTLMSPVWMLRLTSMSRLMAFALFQPLFQ